ncbi:glucose-6-phosphate isomerase [Candidatus Peregrinibacteria bacterium]|nr:glucose-6-phosphate isomerase [Candidatus Peregrinibacteria bacterium]
MLTLDISNLRKISRLHGLSPAEINSLEKIRNRKHGFYEILDDKNSIEKIKKFARQNIGRYKHFVVLGIGGSALGALCLQQSLSHIFKPNNLIVVDNIDPVLIKELEETINLKKTLFIVTSKSGTTVETLAQYYYFRKKTDAAKLKPQNHFVFITDPEKGTLREIAKKENITAFEIPENIGGRFSVFTAVGLLPAALIGINIDRLIKGAKRGGKDFFAEQKKLATIQYLLYKKNKSINVIMPYAQKLIRLADWYRQLLAESIGKKFNNKGKQIHVGITPVNALGATDQHSQIQLYNEGPNDKLIIFIEVKNTGKPLKIPAIHKNLTFNKLLQTEKEATAAALTRNNRPNITIKIDSITEETLGELLMFFEGSIAFLGELFDINAYDQPGVELAKQLTKKMLHA